MDWKTVAKAIDHTVLKPEATRAAIEKLIDPANYLGSASGFIDRVIAAARR